MMVKARGGFFSNQLLTFALGALGISIFFNFLAINRLNPRGAVDDSKFSYDGDDHPTELPVRVDNVAMTFEDTDRYSTSNQLAWYDWHSLDHFPRGHGFVRLGPNDRMFGISMFHQIHCLDMLREALIRGANGHSGHCLNFLRQSILCSADLTLDALNLEGGTNGVGSTHVCRDWTKVYEFVHENHRSKVWEKYNGTTEEHQHQHGQM